MTCVDGATDRKMRNHEFYKAGRLISLNDVYSFDPGNIIGRHFREPKEGLGLDDGARAPIWRMIIWPTKFL